MNKKLILVAGAAITSAGLYSTSVMSANTVNGTSTARVVQAIDVTAGTTLAFGDILSGTPGTVILDTANGVTGSMGASGTGTRTSGTFDVTGANNAVYTITLDATATLTDLVSTNTMLVTGINHDGGLIGLAAGNGTLSGTGTDTVSVGGTLTAAGTEAVGSYTGTYNILVNYN